MTRKQRRELNLQKANWPELGRPNLKKSDLNGANRANPRYTFGHQNRRNKGASKNVEYPRILNRYLTALLDSANHHVVIDFVIDNIETRIRGLKPGESKI